MAKQLKVVEVNGAKYAPLGADGNPILVDDSGNEGPFDYQTALRDNARLRGLAKDKEDWETQRQSMSEKVAAFEKLGKSPEDIAEALKVVSGLKAKDLVDAKQVDALVSERVAEGLKQAKEETAKANERADSYKARAGNLLKKQLFLESEKSGALSKTKLIADAALPMFGDHFELVESDDGAFALVPYRDAARKEKFWNADGKLATGEEALPEILKAHPRSKDFMLGVNAGGGNAPGGPPKNVNNGSKTISRAQFMDMRPEQQMAHVQSGGEITD